MEINSEYHGLRLLAYCGGGAYGDVYYCQDISGQKLAVKIISKQKLGERWKRELQGIINYRHITTNNPKLLKIFHVEEDPDYFFYTMEAADSTDDDSYCPDTLGSRLKKGPLPQKDLFDILSNILDGIRIIHDAGFVHQDIKPDNILFVKGRPKLADLGLISASSMTMSRLAGTLDFIPPEILNTQDPASLDRKTHQQNDFYAFGKVIYCSLTGQSSSAWPTLPPNLPLTLPTKYFLRLTLQLCEKNPDLRLNSGEAVSREFADIDRKLLYGETLRDKLSFLGKTVLRHIKALRHLPARHLHLYFGGILLLLLCSGGLTWHFWQTILPEPVLNLKYIPTKNITSYTGRVSLTIPREWEYVSWKQLGTVLHNRIDFQTNDSLTQERISYFMNILKMGGGDLIICSYGKKAKDYIMIQEFPGLRKKDIPSTKEEILWDLRNQMQGNLKFDVQIYQFQHLRIAGYPSILTDWSFDGGEIRTYSFSIFAKNRMFTITLTADKDTFIQKQKEFLEIMRTIKIQDVSSAKNFFFDLKKSLFHHVRILLGSISC